MRLRSMMLRNWDMTWGPILDWTGMLLHSAVLYLLTHHLRIMYWGGYMTMFSNMRKTSRPLLNLNLLHWRRVPARQLLDWRLIMLILKQMAMLVLCCWWSIVHRLRSVQ